MNSIGRIYRISIYGESHGKVIGVLIDGCPPGIKLGEDDFSNDLLRRKSGGRGTTQRIEEDRPTILSGVFNGHTTGAPINIMFENKNARPEDYDTFIDVPRPGYGDYTARIKYKGFNDHRGGGHLSGRMTLALVAAGVVAKKIIPDISISAKLTEAGANMDISMAIEKAIAEKDSIGGIVECTARNIPAGLGEPFFDSMESQISHICFSIPGIKGIEFGSGFKSAKMTGSENNDAFLPDGTTVTNHAGGINGGISNGNELLFRCAVKPSSSISKVQETANFATGKIVELEISGRHDACFALRVPVIVEAVTAIVLADNSLLYS